jgi:hypothetical protein
MEHISGITFSNSEESEGRNICNANIMHANMHFYLSIFIHHAENSQDMPDEVCWRNY